MADDQSTEAPAAVSPLDTLFNHLLEARNRFISGRKAREWDRFAIARGYLEDTYASFPPEHVPVDLERLRKDMVVYRDSVVDGMRDEIERELRLTLTVLKEVATAHPEIFDKADKKIARHLRKFSRTTPANQPRIVSAATAETLPLTVLRTLDNTQIKALVSTIHKGSPEGGVNFDDLSQAIGVDRDPRPIVKRKRYALSALLLFLKAHGHVEGVGQRRGTRYRPTPTLKNFAMMLER